MAEIEALCTQILLKEAVHFGSALRRSYIDLRSQPFLPYLPIAERSMSQQWSCPFLAASSSMAPSSVSRCFLGNKKIFEQRGSFNSVKRKALVSNSLDSGFRAFMIAEVTCGHMDYCFTSGKHFPSYAEHTIMSVSRLGNIGYMNFHVVSYPVSTIMCNINSSRKYRKFSSN